MKSFGKFVRMYQYDCVCGIRYRNKKFWMAFIIFTIICFVFAVRVVSYNRMYETELAAGWTEYLMNMFKGMAEYVPNSGKRFPIPVVYMTVAIVVAYVTGDYASNDLKRQGICVITRARSRVSWYMAKVLWNITTVVLIFVIAYAVCAVFSLGKLGMDSGTWEGILRMRFPRDMTVFQILVRIIGLPLLSAITISQIQMAISLAVSPVAGFASVMVIHMLSAYTMAMPYIGNYGMLQRNMDFVHKGIATGWAVAVDIVLIVVVAAVGSVIFKRKNII